MPVLDETRQAACYAVAYSNAVCVAAVGGIIVSYWFGHSTVSLMARVIGRYVRVGRYAVPYSTQYRAAGSY